jgi:hypothetical protein
MIHVLEDLPANVIGIEASGQVTSDDYERVIFPAIDDKQREHDKVRLMYVLGPEFDGYSAGAVWEDSKLLFKHPSSWEKIAVVTDEDWIRRSLSVFGWMVPGEVKVFANGDTSQARDWVTH